MTKMAPEKNRQKNIRTKGPEITAPSAQDTQIESGKMKAVLWQYIHNARTEPAPFSRYTISWFQSLSSTLLQ